MPKMKSLSAPPWTVSAPVPAAMKSLPAPPSMRLPASSANRFLGASLKPWGTPLAKVSLS
jgi:hypothetical protein